MNIIHTKIENSKYLYILVYPTSGLTFSKHVLIFLSGNMTNHLFHWTTANVKH